MTKLPHLLALALVGAAGAGPATADPASSSPAVLALLRQQAEAGEVRYAAADVDLNGDGQPEVVAYLMGPNICGSGGCSAVVLVRESGGWRVLTAMDVTQLPIRVLPSRSHGWRDLAVGVSGGGARAGRAWLCRRRGALTCGAFCPLFAVCSLLPATEQASGAAIVRWQSTILVHPSSRVVEHRGSAANWRLRCGRRCGSTPLASNTGWRTTSRSACAITPVRAGLDRRRK